jgi:hypothetical protein
MPSSVSETAGLPFVSKRKRDKREQSPHELAESCRGRHRHSPAEGSRRRSWMTPRITSIIHLLPAISRFSTVPSLRRAQEETGRHDLILIGRLRVSPQALSLASYATAFGPSLFPAGRGELTLVGPPLRLLNEEENEATEQRARSSPPRCLLPSNQ